MAAEFVSGQGRQRRVAFDSHNDYHHNQMQSQHHQPHYMEEPDLDVSSIVTEFVPLDDPFVPYFDVTGEEESELCAPLETSFASSLREGMYARFRPGPPGFPQNTSTPRFMDERVEVARARQDVESLADMMESYKDACARSPHHQLIEKAVSPSSTTPTRLLTEPPVRPPPPLSVLDQFMHSISRLMSDAQYARTTNCFRSKIPHEVTEDALISFLTHCIRYPMRRPINTLLQTRSTPLVLEQVLKTAMDPTAEPYDPTMTRDSHFRITMKNTVHSVGQLYQIIRDISLAHRGFVDVNFNEVRGRIAFIGFNGNLPIRVSSAIGSFIQSEEEARSHLAAHFSTEISLTRCGDDAREVFLTYFDNVETDARTGQQARTTEVNIYHIIHPSPPAPTPCPSSNSPISSSRSPPPSQTPPRGGRVTFPSASPIHHEVHVEKPMLSLAHMTEPTYTLAECFQLSRSYPQHRW